MNFLPRSQVKSFHFSDCFFNEETMTAHLVYSFNEKELVFEETVHFPNASQEMTAQKRNAIKACVRLLHIAAGVSYYKAYVPKQIKIESTTLSQKEAKFFNDFYRFGLGEFCYRNDIWPKISFPYDETVVSESCAFEQKEGCVVAVGGGKDSIVSIETLKQLGEKPILFSVGKPRAIKETIETSGLESIGVIRKISPDLMALNAESDKYDALNGHVPVTGIIAFILMLSSVLYDFSDAILSNERSANVGNIEKEGILVNHQWSKSLAFESAFQELTAEVLPKFCYFSLLRPLSELKIASLFAKNIAYDSVFTSCNQAFKLDESKRLDRWCCNCDKCRFVFLALAPFMEKERLLKIFAHNLLDDISQKEGFEALLGIRDFKPFECVGEIEESLLSFLLLLEKEEWKNDAVIKSLSKVILEKHAQKRDTLYQQVFALSQTHKIPRRYEDALRIFEG